MKKFINRAEDVVEEMLQGVVLLHPGCARLPGHKVIVRADCEASKQRQVAIISGGGSGHEPAHAGYVGEGMLSAAVAGEIFTSPSSDSVYAAVEGTAGPPGALLVVKNYTGDRLNFGLAAEMARSKGIPVEVVLVDDDVALRDSEGATGARGLAGTVLIHKLLGAASAEGKSLSELAAIGKRAVASLRTMGVSFSAGTSPAIGRPSFELGEGEMELGLGIHGEPGFQRTRIQFADDVTNTLLGQIVKHATLGAGRRVALMLNNLGATTWMELAIVARRAVPFLREKGFVVERLYAGTFLSSLDMAGISISVLGLEDEWLRWLDADTAAPAWPRAARQPPKDQSAAAVSASVRPALPGESSTLRRVIEAACTSLIDAEAELTELDRITGDGDLGISMERAARAVLARLHEYPLNDIPATLNSLAQTLQRELGGSSGPLYGVLFLRAATVLGSVEEATVSNFGYALEHGSEAISDLGGARPGDRTMLDALVPFAKALQTGAAEQTPLPGILRVAVTAAEDGAAATAQMRPRLGRSSYLGERVLGHPDPGAKAVVIWLRAVCNMLSM